MDDRSRHRWSRWAGATPLRGAPAWLGEELGVDQQTRATGFVHIRDRGSIVRAQSGPAVRVTASERYRTVLCR